VKEAVAGEPETPRRPAFALTTRPTRLYDPAAWCGECHAEIFSEWSHSTHGATLRIPIIRQEFERVGRERGARAVDVDLRHLTPAGDSAACVQCHAPATFHGDDGTPVLTAGPPVSDGVACSFCHTLRGLRSDVPAAGPLRRTDGDRDGGQLDQYVSAPETVRRYLGQASGNPLLRRLGNLLIRWRPAMHRHDYHSPFLDGAEVCRGCHGTGETTAFDDWKASPYNPSDGGPKVLCQDCHMARQMTGAPVVQPGRLVAWGPVRRQRRTHRFLGGNANAVEPLGDPQAVAAERALVAGSVALRLDEAHLEGARVRAHVTVENRHVGHHFPALRSPREVWIELRALSATGEVLAATPSPAATRSMGSSPPPGAQQAYGVEPIPPHGEGAIAAILDVGDRAPRVARLEARLRQSFDAQPVAVAVQAVR
jgi:hypothetical protein